MTMVKPGETEAVLRERLKSCDDSYSFYFKSLGEQRHFLLECSVRRSPLDTITEIRQRIAAAQEAMSALGTEHDRILMALAELRERNER